MLVREDTIQGVLVLIPSGSLDQHNTVDLETALQRIEDKGTHHIVFNLEKVYSIDSYGIGMLFLTYHRLKAKGIQLTLVTPKPEVKKLLEFVDLPNLIPMADTAEEAASRLKMPLRDLRTPDSQEHKPNSTSPPERAPTWVHRPTYEAKA